MITMPLESKINELLPKHITLTDMFEQKGVFDETIINYWFAYQDDTVYPFELRIEIGRNWLDDEDKTPIVKIRFSTMMAKNGQFLCFENDILTSETRKQALQNVYFRFEALVLDTLKEKGPVGYTRESYQELFKGFRWFAEEKAITSSGRIETVPDVTFSKRAKEMDEKMYRKDTLLAEGKEATRYIRYFLSHHDCDPNVQAFLAHVLQTDKPLRIIKERSYWNYSFLARPDMLYADTETLSKLGYHMQYNREEEEAQAMNYVFDLFSEYAVVNLCLDGETMKELNAEWDAIEKNPLAALKQLTVKIERLQEEGNPFETYEENYHVFLDGLLDLHLKYETLSQQFGETRYKRRADKAKRLWLRYTN